jgi:hypothetical protein
MKPVDFFIVGEPKSGTTALAKFLGEHPEIGISTPKEPDYFATDKQDECDLYHNGKHPYFPVRTEEQYRAGFAKLTDKRLWGEGSTLYISSTEAPKNIVAHNPAAKIIIMLRNPVDFVNSLHQHLVGIATDDEPDLLKALAKEPARRQGRELAKRTRCPSDLFYRQRAEYSEQIKRYQAVFPDEQILILTAEEFRADNARVYKQVLQFLGADDAWKPTEFGKVNESRAPRFKLLHKIMNSLIIKRTINHVFGARGYERTKQAAAKVILKQQAVTELDATTRQELMVSFRPEVEATARLLNRPDLLELWGYES